MPIHTKIAARRKKRKSEGKWVLGEKFSKVGRKRASERTQVKRLAKAYRSQRKTDQPSLSTKGTWSEAEARYKVSRSKGPGKTGKGGRSISEGGAGHVRKGAVGVKSTKGGEFVKYGKKSKAAGSFRSAFKSGCSGGGKSFSWDGRSYSCKTK